MFYRKMMHSLMGRHFVCTCKSKQTMLRVSFVFSVQIALKLLNACFLVMDFSPMVQNNSTEENSPRD